MTKEVAGATMKSPRKAPKCFCIIKMILLVFTMLFNVQAYEQTSIEFQFLGYGEWDYKSLGLPISKNKAMKYTCFNKCNEYEKCNGIFLKMYPDGSFECGFTIHFVATAHALNPNPNILYYQRILEPRRSFFSCKQVHEEGYTGCHIVNYKLPEPDGRILPMKCCDKFLKFMRNKDKSVSFNRPWEDYKHGFGDLHRSFYMGNEILHILTTSRNYKIYFGFRDKGGPKIDLSYVGTRVDSETDLYRLHLGGKDKGDYDISPTHDGMAFTTFDRDNDQSPINCAQKHGGGFWFNDCMLMNPTGVLTATPIVSETGVLLVPAKNYTTFNHYATIALKEE